MPAGLVQEPALTLSLEDEETIRRALHYLDEDERYELWQRVARLDAAAAAGSIPALRKVVDDTPGGTVQRQCIAELASRRISAIINAEQHQAAQEVRTSSQRKPLPWRRNLTARIGSVGQWMDRQTHYWSLSDLDGDLAEPVSLLWRHRGQTPLGLSRALWVGDDGTIMGMFELSPTPLARLAADLMADRAVGFSVGTDGGYHQWGAILDPDEWAPSEGRTDLLIQRYPCIREVSVTPSPLCDGTGVDACW
jgi:hypothetical protein